MKYTQYFLFVRQRPDRMAIRDQWIEAAFNNPCRQEKQSDGRTRKWRYIDEVSKYLRIVFLEDGETVHNAFFDRGFKEEPQ